MYTLSSKNKLNMMTLGKRKYNKDLGKQNTPTKRKYQKSNINKKNNAKNNKLAKILIHKANFDRVCLNKKILTSSIYPTMLIIELMNNR